MESYSIIETFQDLDDAVYFMESQIREHAIEGWETAQGSGLQYVNHQWRVGVAFERSKVDKAVSEIDDFLKDLSGESQND